MQNEYNRKSDAWTKGTLSRIASFIATYLNYTVDYSLFFLIYNNILISIKIDRFVPTSRIVEE